MSDHVVTDEPYAIPGTEDQDDDPLVAHPVPMRRRDFWRVLLGRYRSQIEIRRRMSLRKRKRIMREAFTPSALEQRLYESNPMLDALEGKSGRVPIVRRKDDEA